MTTSTVGSEIQLNTASKPAIPWPQPARCPPALPTGPIRPLRPTLQATHQARCSPQPRVDGHQTNPNTHTDGVNSLTCPCLPYTRLSVPPQKAVAIPSARCLRHTRSLLALLLRSLCRAFPPPLGQRYPRGQTYHRRYQFLICTSTSTRRRHRVTLGAIGMRNLDKQRSRRHRNYLEVTRTILLSTTLLPNTHLHTILSPDRALQGNCPCRVYRQRLRGSPGPR